MMEVLHLTAHLGGGVGKALSGLVRQAAASGSEVRHSIVTLERQEKSQFAELAAGCGCQLTVCPTPERLNELIEASDLVQLEWWNHPATLQALCSEPLPPMRLLVWSHVSGLYNPIIPGGLLRAAQKFLFTSACSFEAREVRELPPELAGRIGVVSSCAGFDGFPAPPLRDGEGLVAGYLGSLNLAKLHPRYLEFLAAVAGPDFSVRLIGDRTNQELLQRGCREMGRPGLLEFRGYTDQVSTELAGVNVLAYLLNPEHYGTTENALVEAMSMGIVPITLNNPAERLIVEHGRTGLIVDSPEEFAAAVASLAANPRVRRTLGLQAAEAVRGRHSAQIMEAALNAHYRECAALGKQHFSFREIFGEDPADWFLSCQGDPRLFSAEENPGSAPGLFARYGLQEQSKGTVFHFQRHFPGNQRLEQWSKRILSLR